MIKKKKKSYEATKDLEETNAFYYVKEASLAKLCPVTFPRHDILGTTETVTHPRLPGPRGGNGGGEGSKAGRGEF